MPEKNPTLLTGAFAALLAGVMQVSVLILLAVKLRPAQIVAAYFVSMLTGGITTVILLVHLKWDPFIAGSLGVASGIAPAIIIPFLALRYGLKRIGLDDTLIDDTLAQIKNAQEDTPHGSR